MPPTADPHVRKALIEHAARLLAEEGPASLTTRRVAAAAGTTTMAVYTHFGGKEQLVRAVVHEGFERLAAELATVRSDGDPVAEVAEQAIAYRANAERNPHLYAAMFGASPVPEYRPTPEDAAHAAGTFLRLVHAVQRCIEAGRFSDGDAYAKANQLWAGIHGVVTLEQHGYLDADDGTAAAMCITMAVGLGDDPVAAARSYRTARRRRR